VVAHLSSRHKKWPAIFHNCYLYGPVQKITILVSAHLRGRYQKTCQSLISVVLRQPLLIIYYWYRLISPPILVSATVTSGYQYWIQSIIIDHFSSSAYLKQLYYCCNPYTLPLYELYNGTQWPLSWCGFPSPFLYYFLQFRSISSRHLDWDVFVEQCITSCDDDVYIWHFWVINKSIFFRTKKIYSGKGYYKSWDQQCNECVDSKIWLYRQKFVWEICLTLVHYQFGCDE
jgi:hypothetical protein